MSERFVVVHSDDAHEKGWHGADCPCMDRNCVWKRDGWELYDTSTMPPALVGRDGGEPEDQLLVRDWEWVPTRLNEFASEVSSLRSQLAKVTEERDALKAEHDAREGTTVGHFFNEVLPEYERLQSRCRELEGAVIKLRNLLHADHFPFANSVGIYHGEADKCRLHSCSVANEALRGAKGGGNG